MANQEHVEILKQGIAYWNRWRGDNSDLGVKPDLSNENLIDTNLTGVDLTDTNLSGANLTATNLTAANLTGANLSGANLQRANLHFANINFVNLQNINLSGANLERASLQITTLNSTSLDRTRFNGAIILGVTFADVDISTAIGLESVIHGGPSTIGLDTLIRSKGKIPEVFLRGCGVPEEFITYLPSLLANPIEFYSCFISYSREDKAFARQLHDFLQGRGIRCWLDEHHILPGHNIYDEVDRGMKLWDKVLLCASKNSLTSLWVNDEIEKAFVKEQSLTQRRGEKVRTLIPLNLDGYLFDWEDSKADKVRSRLAADFTGWETDNQKMQQQLELVVKALRTDGGRQTPPKSLL